MLFCGSKLRIGKRSVVTIMSLLWPHRSRKVYRTDGLLLPESPVTAALLGTMYKKLTVKKNVTYLDGKKRDSSGTLTSQNTTGIELLTESHRSPFVSPYRELTAGTCGRRGNLPHQDLYPTPKLCNNSRGTNFRDRTVVSCNIPTSPHHAPLPLLCTKLDSPNDISFPS